jgi:F0F1-type ATP synthase gamma subunit
MKTYEIYYIDDENMVKSEIFRNCENEIQNNLKTYRSLRQENITREINELISGRC